jgi:hypothetical protein
MKLFCNYENLIKYFDKEDLYHLSQDIEYSVFKDILEI